MAFVFLEPATKPIADETMWLMALQRIPAASFSPFANYPIFHPPLYPYFLAGLDALFGSLLAVKLAQALIGSLLIPATHALALRVFGLRTANFAAALVAFYPEFVWYAAHFWCETIFVALLWWGIERASSAEGSGRVRDAILAGVLFGLAILTRETLLYLVPLVALWIARSAAPRARIAGVMLATTFVVVAPWTIRNAIQFGTFIPVSTGGGLNLYQGNAPLSRDEVYREYYANEGKVDQYRWARTEGLRVIWERQPLWILEKIRDEGPRLAELDSLALIHLRRGAYADVSCGTYRGVAFLVLTPWLLVAASSVVALSRLRWNRGSVLVAGFAAAYLLLHIATHGFSRYRLPVVPALLILAASVFDASVLAPMSPRRRTLLLCLAVALALLLAPSAVDQAGFMGFAARPEFEGFAPVCGR